MAPQILQSLLQGTPKKESLSLEESQGHRLGMCFELCFAFILRFFFASAVCIFLLHLFCICCLCVFSCLLACLNFALRFFFVFAGLLELCFALFLHSFGLKRPRPGKMRNKGTSKSQGRPTCKKKKRKPGIPGRPKCKKNKKNASLETEAGQNTNKNTKTNAKAMQKFAVIAEISVSWSICIFCVVFFAFSLRFSAFLLHCFFAFWPASVSRLAFFFFFCILAGQGFQACVFFFFLHFGRPWDSDVPSFRILPGLGRFSRKECKNNAKHNSSRPTNTKKKQSKIQAGQQTRKKHKQQMQNKCNKKMQTADAKKEKNIVRIGVDNVLGWTRRSPLRFC